MSSFQKHQQKLTILFFLLVIVISSCTKPKSKLAKYGSVLEDVIRSDSSAFRGFNLGDKLDSIQKKEAGKPIESDTAYLYYEYKLDSSNTFNITYNFDDDGLNEIQSDIFIHNPNNTENVFNAFKAFFDDHYGASESHGGFTVWLVKSKKFGDVRINLSDESADFTTANSPGKISLWIYPDKD
jgi:hypothetical protein